MEKLFKDWEIQNIRRIWSRYSYGFIYLLYNKYLSSSYIVMFSSNAIFYCFISFYIFKRANNFKCLVPIGIATIGIFIMAIGNAGDKTRSFILELSSRIFCFLYHKMEKKPLNLQSHSQNFLFYFRNNYYFI